MTKEIIEKHKKITEESVKTPEFDITYRSRYSNVKITGDFDNLHLFGKENNKVFMADYLMFNKFYNLDYNLVDRLLPYCKIRTIDDYTYKVDGWILTFNAYGRPSYRITYDNSDYDETEFIKTEKEKRLAVRLFVQVMNETPEEFVNFNNYQVIAEWYRENDNTLDSYNQNMFLYNEYKKNKKEENNSFSREELVISLDDKITKEKLVDVLICNRKNGKNDVLEMGLSENLSIVDNYEKMIADTKQLNLTDYYEKNGYSRTKSVIDSIKHTIKYRVNCDNYLKQDGSKITKAELFATLYNSCMAFGMGIMENDDRSLSIDEAEKILKSHRNYFDYYNGVAIKMCFNTFPIIDYQRFDKYNGNGKFMECLLKIQCVDKSIYNKVKLTGEHVRNEIARMFKPRK